MKKERILLLSGNFYPEPTGIGKYSGEMIDWFSLQGHECGVVTTYPYYPFWKIQAPHVNKSAWFKREKKEVSAGVSITIYRCPHFIPKIPCGKKRIFSDFSFFLSALFQVIVLLFRKKYDVVIAVAPPFQLGLLGLLYKWVKGATMIYHIQDLQIDAACELGMIKSKFLLKTMFWLERFIIRNANYVSSISDGMIRKIKVKHDRPVILFPNWADSRDFYPVSQKEELKRAFQFSPNDKIVLYSGAIGEKQGLQALLHTAKVLQEQSDIKFIICGSGPYKEKLIDLAGQMGLSNVIFRPLQPKELFNHFLNMADLHLVLQKANANDLVMPSKLTTILSVGGLALVTAEPKTSLHTLVSTHEMGILIEPENGAALTASILTALSNPYKELRENARRFAETHLAIDTVVSRFFAQVTNVEKAVVIREKTAYVTAAK